RVRLARDPGAVGLGHRGDVRGQRPHLLLPGEPGRRRLQERVAGRRQPRAQRPGQPAGVARAWPGGGPGRSRRGVGPVGRGAGLTLAATIQERPGQKAARRRNLLWVGLFLSPWIIGFCVFTAWPVLYSGYLSFTDYDVLTDPEWVGLANYEQMIADPRVRLSLWNTFYFTA